MGATDSKLATSTDSPGPYSTAFLNWNEKVLESEQKKTIIFLSLIATMKFQPALDDYLETKAAKILESVIFHNTESADDFLGNLGRTINESSRDFVQSIVVLILTPSLVIATTTMKMLQSLVLHCSAKGRIALVKADLIPQLIITLNPHSLSFTEAVDININLMKTISKTLWLTTPDGLNQLKIKDDNEQQAVHETSKQTRISEPFDKSVAYFEQHTNSM
ncbi:hypothetical protein BLNAU_14326 [Blattamonas nauphoetae]|uniref:Uncharacterized protein n=1 Tax=Blattamonas nauphoetae TaxID=2049346 RepID=A0ABQ9XHI8_9EUKA|nr:hypothetical protein BLNAU_14326 [Blattamonas nauphoetae]